MIWRSFAVRHSDSGQGKEGLNPTMEVSASIALGTPSSACRGEGLFC